MRLIRKAHLAPGHHECAYMSFKPSERDGTWIELLLADPAKVSLLFYVESCDRVTELCALHIQQKRPTKSHVLALLSNYQIGPSSCMKHSSELELLC